MDDSAPVLVTGGTGTLGTAVVARLRARSRPLRVLSRTPRPANPVVFAGDLSTGEGLRDALMGVGAVIHCATHPLKARAVEVEGTRRLLDALAAAGRDAHLVYISIVGCGDDNALSYYRVKAQAEDVVTAAASAGRNRASIVRATQFHNLVRLVSRIPPKGPVALACKGMRFQPCDTRFVAEHLVDVALSGPLTTPLELAGPEVLTLRETIALTARHQGRRAPRVLTLPTVGGILKSFAAGANLPGPGATLGGSTYAEWLTMWRTE